jgi:hypothetical protein
MENRAYKIAKWTRAGTVVLAWGSVVMFNHIPFELPVKIVIYLSAVAAVYFYGRFFKNNFGAIDNEYQAAKQKEIEENYKAYLYRQSTVNKNISQYLAAEEARKRSKKWWQIWV